MQLVVKLLLTFKVMLMEFLSLIANSSCTNKNQNRSVDIDCDQRRSDTHDIWQTYTVWTYSDIKVVPAMHVSCFPCQFPIHTATKHASTVTLIYYTLSDTEYSSYTVRSYFQT